MLMPLVLPACSAGRLALVAPAEVAISAAAMVPATAARSTVAMMIVVSVQPAVSAAPLPPAAMGVFAAAPLRPAAMGMFAVTAVAKHQTLAPVMSTIPVMAENPAGDLPRPDPEPCRLAGGPCNR